MFLDRFRQKGPSRPRSKAETEKRRRLVIVLLIVLAVVSSLSVVGYGYYSTSVRPWHGRIVKVNGTVIEMRTFVKTLRLNGVTSSDSARSVAMSMEENELMRQELEGTFGVAIDEEAVDAELRKMLVSDNATDEEYEEQYDSWVANLKNYGISVRDIRELYLKPSLVEKELKKQIGGNYPTDGIFEHAQVQALLVEGSDNATLMRTRWENGEAFDTLATDNSVSKSRRDTATDNTTIEWVAKGVESTAFDSYTFSEAAVGALSDPIPDTDNSENYWLIKVFARESRPLSESDRTTLTSKAFDKWLEDAKNPDNNDIVFYLDKKGGQAKVAWALDHVTVSKS